MRFRYRSVRRWAQFSPPRDQPPWDNNITNLKRTVTQEFSIQSTNCALPEDKTKILKTVVKWFTVCLCFFWGGDLAPCGVRDGCVWIPVSTWWKNI